MRIDVLLIDGTSGRKVDRIKAEFVYVRDFSVLTAVFQIS